MLIDNINLFTWKPSNIPRIDLKVVFHQLSLDSSLNVRSKGNERMEKKKGRRSHKRSESS